MRNAKGEFLKTLYEQKEQIEEHIRRYELPEDPYAELKEAFAAGKRIAVRAKRSTEEWLLSRHPTFSAYHDWKIVEDDETYTGVYIVQGISSHVKTKYTKCALTGKITAEVVAND